MRAPERVTVVCGSGAFVTKEPIVKVMFNGVECFKLSNPRNPGNPLVGPPEGSATYIPVKEVVAIHVEPLEEKALLTT